MEDQTIQWLNDKRRKDKNDPQYTTQWTTHISHLQNPSDELLILQLRFIIQEIKLDGHVNILQLIQYSRVYGQYSDVYHFIYIC
jgi:hypothetical protein